MLLAALELLDFVAIAGIVAVFSGGAAARASLGRKQRERLERIDRNLELIMVQLGMQKPAGDAASSSANDAEWQALADDPNQKIMAIKVYREQYGVGLAEAKQAVEDYMAQR